MNKLRIGTGVKLKKRYVKWMAENADDMYAYPRLMIPGKCTMLGYTVSLEDQLTEYFMNRYSYERGLDIHGIIIGDNSFSGNEFCYLVWSGNELGEETCYIDPKDIERIK